MKKDKKKKNLFKRPLFLFTSLFLAAGILFTGTIAAQAAPEEPPAKEEISIKNTVEKLPKPVDPTDEALIPTKVEPAPSQEAQTLNRSPFKAPGTLTIPLDADLMLGSDTGNNPITVNKTDNMNFVGVLEVKPIKDQMSELDNEYTEDDLKQIKISGLSTGFTAKLTLPTELTFKQPINASLEGANGSFDVKSASLNGQTATVELELTNADKISNYKELKDAIMNVDDQLKVVLKSANFNAKAKPYTDYKVTGEITGDFNATATFNGLTQDFGFRWTGVQTTKGASSLDPNEIALSVNYKEELYGDLIINRNSQNNKNYYDTVGQCAYVTQKDSSLTITGRYWVFPIQLKMQEIYDNFNDGLKAQNPSLSDLDKGLINIKGLNTTFKATLTLPDGMEFSSTDVDKVKATFKDEKGSKAFTVSKVEFNGQKVTVTMVLADKSDTNFEELQKRVNGVGDFLEVSVPGIKFSNGATEKKHYQITGTVHGEFNAKASIGTLEKPFNFSWDAVQKDNYRDACSVDNKAITATVMFVKSPPPTPSTIDISVKKVWKDKDDIDQTRPDQITVRLYADGEYTGKALDLSEKNQWSGSFKDLDKENTKGRIQYTVKEVRVPGYDSNVEGNAKDGFTIVNRLSEKKPWTDIFPPDYENRHPIFEEVERKEEVKIVVPEEKPIVARPSEEAPIPQNPPTGESPIIMAAALFLGISAMGLVGFIGGRKRDTQ